MGKVVGRKILWDILYLHKLSSGFQQPPEFVHILLKKQGKARALAWRPTLALVPSLLPGLHTYSTQAENGAACCSPSGFPRSAVSGKHSLAPTPDTGDQHTFKSGPAALRSPHHFSPSGGGGLPLLTWVEGINWNFLLWDGTSWLH